LIRNFYQKPAAKIRVNVKDSVSPKTGRRQTRSFTLLFSIIVEVPASTIKQRRGEWREACSSEGKK
jgi:hypothetical protein